MSTSHSKHRTRVCTFVCGLLLVLYIHVCIQEYKVYVYIKLASCVLGGLVGRALVNQARPSLHTHTISICKRLMIEECLVISIYTELTNQI